jgi:N6-adenosine-specific RNA methylase IME4
MPVADSARGRFTTVIRARSREHSRKPDEAYDIIAALYPEASRIDVFSREKRPGWDQYGNECNYFDGGGV